MACKALLNCKYVLYQNWFFFFGFEFDLKYSVQAKLTNVLQQSVRYRGKFNTASPRPRHYIARYLEEITKPVIIRQLPDTIALCSEFKEKQQRRVKSSINYVIICFRKINWHIAVLNLLSKQDKKFENKFKAIDLEKFLAKEVVKYVSSNDVMLIVHRNECTNDQIRLNTIDFRKHSVELKVFNIIIMKFVRNFSGIFFWIILWIRFFYCKIVCRRKSSVQKPAAHHWKFFRSKSLFVHKNWTTKENNSAFEKQTAFDPYW